MKRSSEDNIVQITLNILNPPVFKTGKLVRALKTFESSDKEKPLIEENRVYYVAGNNSTKVGIYYHTVLLYFNPVYFTNADENDYFQQWMSKQMNEK